MRDKVRLEDLKILLICPSANYLSIHRKVIKDCQYFRDIGGNPTLYCLKDSEIDKEASKYALPRLLFSGLVNSRFIKLSYFLDIRKTLREGDWDIVHCYDLTFLWAASFWLFRKVNTALFVTTNQYFSGKSTNPLSRFLLKRVDFLLTFSRISIEQTRAYFDLPLKKMQMIGLGIEDYNTEKSANYKQVIGCFLDTEKDFDNLKALISALSALNTQKLKLNIYTHKVIKDYYRYSEVQRYINQIGAIQLVEFKLNENTKECLAEVELFVNISISEPLCDYEIQALLGGTPTISPRSASRQEILLEFPEIIKTYYLQDSRELRLSISSYLDLGYDQKVHLYSYKEKLLEQQGLESYAQKIQNSYEWAVAKRKRLSDSRRQ
jgi:hypothetical protein